MRSHSLMCMVEIAPNGLPCRIFRSDKLAYQSGKNIGSMLYASAVRCIRTQCYERSQGVCERCAKNAVTLESGELHERDSRGMRAFKLGEISLENSIFVCPWCHRKDHKWREPQWSRHEKVKNDR